MNLTQRQRNIMYILNRLQIDGTTLPPCDVKRELKSFRVHAEINLAKMGTAAVPGVIMPGLGGKRKREMTRYDQPCHFLRDGIF